ncbi:hypothetical protein PMIN03_002645 [Paraphaeosphaeria minitans]|uniref:Uncharacterized protein n=1 Tax=Paraphaeosphaeria minitans TaxID=565426 RepID=A0A9P6KLB8_9PLEO|nr:hypothetical protein PMIN01_11544 [Paraphaeosphaeria minitans]
MSGVTIVIVEDADAALTNHLLLYARSQADGDEFDLDISTVATTRNKVFRFAQEDPELVMRPLIQEF